MRGMNNPIALRVAVAWAAATLAAGAAAQAGSTAQQRYERALAACNRGSLPAPRREACVRAAGNALDRALGGTPAAAPRPSDDGRATVVSPPGAPPPSSGGGNAVPSSDGRATIVPPADRTAPR
jgi:hypothetical protein